MKFKSYCQKVVEERDKLLQLNNPKPPYTKDNIREKEDYDAQHSKMHMACYHLRSYLKDNEEHGNLGHLQKEEASLYKASLQVAHAHASLIQSVTPGHENYLSKKDNPDYDKQWQKLFENWHQSMKALKEII